MCYVPTYIMSVTYEFGKKKKTRFSRLSKVRKTILVIEHEKLHSPLGDCVPNTASKRTINILKSNIRQRILETTRCLRKSDSWLLSMEKGDVKDVEHISISEANTAFLWAAYLGEFDLMKFFETKGANVKYVNERENFNALHLSALNGSVECCEWLYEKGCPVSMTADALTPMHFAVFTDSKDVVEFLLDKGCFIHDTVINSAVCANAIECVKLLLSFCVQVNAYQDGMTPLHIATDFRRIECMKMLLNIPSIDVDLKTEPGGSTALHLAAENGYADCLELLLNENVKIGEVNRRQQTALHLACKGGHLDCVEILLKNRASVSAVDVNLKTPLHAALLSISNNQQTMDIVKLLVHWKADVNVSDRFGYTPLHLAAFSEFEECATYLIINGANVAAETKTGITALHIIRRKIPRSIPAIWKRFTQSLAYNSEKSLKFSFRELVTNSSVGEAGFLYTLQEEGYREMLQHPLCRAFVHLKWQKIKWYFFFRFLLVLITACMVSFFVMINFTDQCCHSANNENATSSTHSAVPSNCSNTAVPKNEIEENLTQCPLLFDTLKDLMGKEQLSSMAWWVRGVAILTTILHIIQKLPSIVAYSSVKHYWSNHLNMVESLATVAIFSLCFNNEKFKCRFEKVTGTAAVLLSWIYLTLTIGQLPFFGTYIIMFKKVLAELLRLLLVYFCLLIGFTITFSVIFPNEAKFGNPIIGFVRTLAMMTGELDLNEITNGSNLPTYHAISLYCVLTFFVVLVTMALMNLLIGIAVSDVDGLKKTADITKLVHQTQLMYHLEWAFFHGYIPRKFTNRFKNLVLVWPNLHKVVIYVRPLNAQEKRIPKHILLEALQFALDKHNPDHNEEDKLNDISSRIERLENKMSKMCGMLSRLTTRMNQNDSKTL